MAVIKAAHYGETEARLTQDPIVIAMAKGLADVPRGQLVHERAVIGGNEVTPRFEFMQSANAEYRQRGGTDGGHIGAVAHALLNLLDSGIAPPTKVVRFYAGRSVPSARGDFDTAMTSVDIHSGDDEDEARKALVNYMVNVEGASLAKYRSEPGGGWATDRMAAIFDAVQQVMFAKFDGGQSREAKVFDADGIQFQLVRTER